MLSRAAGPLSAILRRLIVVARAINICTYRESGSDQDRGATLFIRDTKKTLGCRLTSFTLIFCFALASKYGVLNCSARASASATDTCTIIKTGDAGWPSFARAVMDLYTSDKTPPTCQTCRLDSGRSHLQPQRTTSTSPRAFFNTAVEARREKRRETRS